MTTPAFSEVCFDKDSVRAACVQAFETAARLVSAGPVLIEVGPSVAPVEVLQRKFLHGPVLGQIAEQVYVTHADGTRHRYAIDVWKEHFRKRFVGANGYRYEMRQVPKWDAEKGTLVQPKRATPVAIRISTEELGRREYAKFIDQVIDHAQAEWNVEFVFTREEHEYRQAMRPKRKPNQEGEQ